jgi:hypothetical protein
MLTDEQTTKEVGFSLPKLPDLQHAVEDELALGSTYWTPENIGEFKRGIVIGIEEQVYNRIDDKTGEITFIDLQVVIMAEQKPDLSWHRISNGGKRLVSTIEQSLATGAIVPFKTPVQIKYLGKKKNSTNGFHCDSFEVKPLKL